MTTGIDGTQYPIDDAELDQLFREWAQFSHIALAVSGGADSIALMRLAHRWLSRQALPSPLAITILTVDHGLRPEAAAEADWVKQQALNLSFPHETLRWDGPKPKSAVQAAAREARYRLMTGYCHANAIPALATAHTRDDQVETFIMRLARGSGLDGLAAISETSMRDGIALLRPLLSLSRARIEEILRACGQSWLDDPSNQDERFERVRLRRMMPALEAAGLPRDRLALSAKRLNRARKALEAVTSQFLSANLTVHPAAFGTIPVSAFLNCPEEIALKSLMRMARAFGGRSINPRLAKVEGYYDTLRQDPRGGTLGGCIFLIRGGKLIVAREYGRMDTEPITIAPGQSRLWDGRFKVTVSARHSGPLSLQPLGLDGIAAVKTHKGIFEAIPRPAILALPSFWMGDRLNFVPFVTFINDASPPQWQPKDDAEFVNLPILR